MRSPDTGGRTDACPYKGLAAFEESDAAYFYGRERLVGELAARTVGMGLLGVVGPSGSGKSSVVMAGLLPSLAAGLLPGSERWGHASLRPGEHPVDALETALASGGPGERLVLVVDQFEEVFSTTADESERAAFVDRLVELARDPERCVVVVTIRADYTGHCAPYPELAELLASNLMLVGPMTPDELRRAIELPARRVGLRVESALVDALVDEVAEEPGGLPLLSTALVELWQARDGGWLRLEAHERTGGVRGAVARLAETSFGRLEGEEREAARARPAPPRRPGRRRRRGSPAGPRLGVRPDAVGRGGVEHVHAGSLADRGRRHGGGGARSADPRVAEAARLARGGRPGTGDPCAHHAGRQAVGRTRSGSRRAVPGNAAVHHPRLGALDTGAS